MCFRIQISQKTTFENTFFFSINFLDLVIFLGLSEKNQHKICIFLKNGQRKKVFKMCFKIQISQKTTFENTFFFFSMKKFGLCNFSETRCPVPTKNTGHSGHFTGLYRTYRTLQDLQDFTGHTGFTGLWYACAGQYPEIRHP